MYGFNLGGGTKTFGAKCLLARRMVERGVRFVQVYSNDEWDAHGGIAENHTPRCQETDVPIAGLLTDLKQRGLLESTLVIWGGEFGRMPVSERAKRPRPQSPRLLHLDGRRRHQGGLELRRDRRDRLKAAVDPVSVPDIHATILHLLGIDHTRLTFDHNGRKYRLTDTSGNVIRSILA